jgi:hypothetical protein
MTPNPSIERTRPGQAGHTAHVKCLDGTCEHAEIQGGRMIRVESCWTLARSGRCGLLRLAATHAREHP